jgi:uncharacterized protein (DUF2147 family)
MWVKAGTTARKIARLLSVTSILLGAGVAAASAAPIEGAWATQNGTEVSISPCGAEYCGTLSWIVIPKEHTAECLADRVKFGSEMLDYQNPDKSLRSRSLVGMVMMTLKPTNDPNNFDVHVYDAEHGKFYDGTASTTNGGNTLRLGNGCVFGVCVVSQDWPRVPVRPGVADFSCGS